MEEDNKKERRGMKRSHNDAVRELVAFVRKRDKRLAAHQSSEAKKKLQREEEEKQRSGLCSGAALPYGIMQQGTGLMRTHTLQNCMLHKHNAMLRLTMTSAFFCNALPDSV